MMEPFITAYARVNEGRRRGRRHAAEWLMPLKHHLADGGLGPISEILSMATYRRNREGASRKAWSVAEGLRAEVEDVQGFRPARTTEVHGPELRRRQRPQVGEPVCLAE